MSASRLPPRIASNIDLASRLTLGWSSGVVSRSTSQAAGGPRTGYCGVRFIQRTCTATRPQGPVLDVRSMDGLWAFPVEPISETVNDLG